MASQLLDYLISSNELRFDLVSIAYDSKYIGSGTTTASTICPRKSGGLEFTLNTSRLNIQYLSDMDFDIVFTGEDVGVDGASQRILWTANSQNISKPIPSTPAILDSIQAQFTSVSSALPDVNDKNCAGASVDYGALFETPDPGTIEVKYHGSSSGFGFSDDATGTITIHGVAGVTPTVLAAKIFNRNAFCDPPIIGSQGTSSAYVSGIPFNTTVTYKWIVQSAVVIGPDDQWFVQYTLPGLSKINVSLTVTAGDQTATAATTIYATSSGMARLEKIICELRHRAIVVRWSNLLINPMIAAAFLRRLSPSDLETLMHSAAQITRLIRQIHEAGRDLLATGRE